MDKRFGTIVITLLSVALAACSVAPAANLPPPSAPPTIGPAAAVTRAPGEDFQSLHQSYESRAKGAGGTATSSEPREDFLSLHRWYQTHPAAAGGAPTTSTSGQVDDSVLTPRHDGRAPSFTTTSSVPGEDFQSLHASYDHAAR